MDTETIFKVLIGVGILAGIIFFIAFIKRFQRCPPDKLMVISGKVGKGEDGKPRSSLCLHGGAKFVIPLIQEVHFLDLTPFSININLEGALSKQNIRVSVPATFTVGISTEMGIMQKAAERLLGQPLRAVQELGKEIIYGQLRLVIAQLEIEELNSKRDQFQEMVFKNIETELNKIGLKLINANITDIKDESGYIEALGRKAEAEVLNKAKRDVAAHNREGNVGEKEEQMQEQMTINEKDREQREAVARSRNLAETAEAREKAKAAAEQSEIDKDKCAKIAKANAEKEAAQEEAATAKRARIAKARADAEAAEAKAAADAQAAKTEAAKDLRMKVANANAEAEAAEKESETDKRTKVAATTAKAVAAENDAKAQIALSEAKRLEVEAQAKARAVAADKVQNAKALSEAYAAEEKAEIARASRTKAAMQADVIVKQEIEKQRLTLAAEAEAEAIRRKAKGEADARLAMMEAEAEGIKLQLAKRAEAYAMFVNAAGGDPDSAVRLMMADKAEALVKTQVDAIKGINIDKITVWDSMPGDGTSTTSNFVKSLMKSIPPIKDVYDMIGVGLPGISKDDDKKDDVNKEDIKEAKKA